MSDKSTDDNTADESGSANDVELVRITGPNGEWTIAFCTEIADESGQGWVKKDSQEKLGKALDLVLGTGDGGRRMSTEQGAGSMEPEARCQKSEIRSQKSEKGD